MSNYPTNQNSFISNNNKINKNNNDELPRLGRKKASGKKKSVSFSNNIQVTEVENWKKYNTDVSQENEYIKLKREVEKYKALQKKENECCCNIF